MLEIAYVAGEASGDRHAAALHHALVETAPSGESLGGWGIGGSAMRSAGVEIAIDSSTWGAIGVVASLRGLSEYVAAMKRLKISLIRRRPAALVLVDFGYFNVRLARWARRSGIGPIVYYMPPGSWKRRAGGKSMSELASLCDLIVTPFEWSNANLRAAGANSHWLGHPLIDIVRPTRDPEQFDEEYGVDPARPVISLLPGSRTAEVEHILPMMLRASGIISRRVPGTQFLLAAAPNLDRSMIEGMVRNAQAAEQASVSPLHFIVSAGGRLKEIAASALGAARPAKSLVTSEGFVVNNAGRQDSSERWTKIAPASPAQTATLAIVDNLAHDCLNRSDLVITASGTATLEAAILGRPMIIVYRGSKLMELEYHLRKKRLGIEYVGLPNIVAGREVVPELLQDEASPDGVADRAVEYLIEPQRLMAVKKLLASEVAPALGEPGVVQRAARLIWTVIHANLSGVPAEGNTNGDCG